MPLIYNNKVYKLVNDDSDWDKLEFVPARKLHVQYTLEQVIITPHFGKKRLNSNLVHLLFSFRAADFD